MPDIRRTRIFALGSALLVVPILSFGGCGKKAGSKLEQNVRVVDLLANFPQAKVETEEIGNVSKTTLPVGGENREVLFMHPIARVTYPPVRMTLESRLDLSFGVSEKAWDQGGDGVQFSVYAQPSRGDKVRIFSSYLDPKHVDRDRRWADSVVTLGIYAGQEVALTLETDPGPARNLGWDWAGWSRATLTLGTE